MTTMPVQTLAGGTPSSSVADPLALWRGRVRVSPVSSAAQHSIHAYYTATPESPDGTQILFYASTTPEGHTGSLHLVDRATGRENVLATNIEVEDAHRAACQQWVSGGRRIVFHDVRDGRWVVVALDVPSGQARVLAEDRQLAWGQPDADLVPLYGPHWDPHALRDLELLDVSTGEIRTVLAAAAVRDQYPELIQQEFGDRPISIFFPALSPDLTRVFFKIATPLGGHFRSTQASHRALLVCYDLARERFLFIDERWGHPAWHPNSRTILDVPHVLIDSETGQRRFLDLPKWPGSHPSFSPDGRLSVTDVALDRLDGPLHGASGEWGVVVEDLHSGEHVLVDRFDHTQGARSWRRSHPHPVFGADSSRFYFCTSASTWTRLYLAAAG
jgi:hypothetical protein